MLVTSQAEPETFALVGGLGASRFSVKASAHAVSSLSDYLYRDKPGAVVREYICNAIDAHTRDGVKNPIEVTLTDNMLTVRDFGAGIPDDDIDLRFCTFFESDKRQRAEEIGGFGVGCKVGWSISDHFIVISRCAGVQTTYVMHKGGADSDFFPVRETMSSFPTTETGVEIQVPVASSDMRDSLKSALKTFTYYASAPISLNGHRCDQFNFKALEEHRFYRPHPIDRASLRSVSVLHADVLYPVDSDPFFAKELNRVEKEFGKIVLHAPKGSVSYAMSRETLGYDRKTQVFIRRALRHALHETETLYRQMRREATRRWVKFGSAKGFGPSQLKIPRAPSDLFGARANALNRLHHFEQNEFPRLKDVLVARWSRNHRPKVIVKTLKRETYRPGVGNGLDQKAHSRILLRILAHAPNNTQAYLSDSERNRRLKHALYASKAYGTTIFASREGVCHFGSPSDEHEDEGIQFVSRGFTDAAIRDLNAYAQRFGWNVQRITKTPPRAKPEKVAKIVEPFKFRMIADLTTMADGSIGVEAPSANSAAYYVVLPRGGEDRSYADGANKIALAIRYAGDLFPSVAIASNATDIKLLEAAGVPSLGRYLIEEIKRRVEAQGKADKRFSEMSGYGWKRYHFGERAMRDHEIHCLARQIKYDPAEERDFRFWRFVRDFESAVHNPPSAWRFAKAFYREISADWVCHARSIKTILDRAGLAFHIDANSRYCEPHLQDVGPSLSPRERAVALGQIALAESIVKQFGDHKED